MYTQQEKEYLITAIEAALASNKRAQNTNKNPQFKQIYEQVSGELNQLLAKTRALKVTDK